MLLPVFEFNFLLQSLGWAIINSFWQIGTLWLIYKFITGIDKKLSSLVKHHFSMLLLITSVIWFIFTIQQNYQALVKGELTPYNTPNQAVLFQIFDNVLPVISVTYLLLLCRCTTKFVKSLSANRFLQKSGLTKAPIDIRLFTEKTAFHLGIRKKIRVWVSEHVDVPSVTGFVKPVILLPAAILTQLSIQQTEAILLHELAHIKRNDYLVNLVQALIELLLFFNPFAILLSKAARKERENCCDDWVMNFQYDRHDYARALLVLEEQRRGLQFNLALAATNGRKNLLQRIKRLFNTTPQTDFSTLQKIKFTVLCFFLLTVVATILPFMRGKHANNKVYNSNKEAFHLVNTGKGPIENNVGKVFAAAPVMPKKVKRQAVSEIKPKRQSIQKTATEYVNALINEELLRPATQVEPIINHVVEREIKATNYLVKIEEQQSGKTQTNTYYFELNNNDGTAAIKPLIVLNKIKMTLTGIPRMKDSLTLQKKLKKKRTTS